MFWPKVKSPHVCPMTPFLLSLNLRSKWIRKKEAWWYNFSGGIAQNDKSSKKGIWMNSSYFLYFVIFFTVWVECQHELFTTGVETVIFVSRFLLRIRHKNRLKKKRKTEKTTHIHCKIRARSENQQNTIVWRLRS